MRSTGMAQMDAAILVVSAADVVDNVMPQTREHHYNRQTFRCFKPGSFYQSARSSNR